MTTMTSDTIYVYCWWFIGDETQVWRQQEMSLWKVLGPVEVGRIYFDSYGLAQKNFLVQRTQRNCWTCVAVQNFISARTFHFHEFHFSSYPAGKNTSNVFASIFQKKGIKVSLTRYEMRTWNKEEMFLSIETWLKTQVGFYCLFISVCHHLSVSDDWTFGTKHDSISHQIIFISYRFAYKRRKRSSDW